MKYDPTGQESKENPPSLASLPLGGINTLNTVVYVPPAALSQSAVDPGSAAVCNVFIWYSMIRAGL